MHFLGQDMRATHEFIMCRPSLPDKDIIESRIATIEEEGGLNTVRRKSHAAPFQEWNGMPHDASPSFDTH